MRLVLSFSFVWFILNVIVFVYNRLKQSLILQTKPNSIYRFLFFIGILFIFVLKKRIVLHVERFGYESSYVCHICISYFFLQICIRPGTRSLSHKEKKLTKFCMHQHYGMHQFSC